MPEQEQLLRGDEARVEERSGSPLVLVIEDDAVILRLVAETLAEEGYAIAAAPHGAAGLELIARRHQQGLRPPELIVLDMRMPVLDGWAFATRYRQMPGPHAPLLVITAAHDALDRAAEIGAQAVLPKPFDLSDLLAAVEACVGIGKRSSRAAG